MGVLHFVAWLAATALVGVNAMLARSVVTLAILRIGAGMSREEQVNRQARGVAFGWTATVAGMVTTVVMACAAVALIVGIEYYFRRGAQRGELVKRIVKVLAIGVVVGAVLYGSTLLLV
jgi:cytochrome bd-type quinol oxidase subunit 2